MISDGWRIYSRYFNKVHPRIKSVRSFATASSVKWRKAHLEDGEQEKNLSNLKRSRKKFFIAFRTAWFVFRRHQFQMFFFRISYQIFRKSWEPSSNANLLTHEPENCDAVPKLSSVRYKLMWTRIDVKSNCRHRSVINNSICLPPSTWRRKWRLSQTNFWKHSVNDDVLYLVFFKTVD